MRLTSLRSMQHLGVVVTLAAFAACGTDNNRDAADSTADPNLGMPETPANAAATTSQWTATLDPVGGSGVSGNASVTAGSGAGSMSAQVTVNGAPANGVHPWHVHVGTCASGGQIYGPAADYPPLNVDANGTATATATVNSPAPTTGEYHVNVHMSPDDLGTIVACGNVMSGAPM